MGCGISGGIEVAVHAARTLTHMFPMKAWLRIDSWNAYSSLFALCFLLAVAEKIPHLLPFLWNKYKQPSQMEFDGVPILSKRDTNQGGPLSGHAFTLAFDEVLEFICREFSDIVSLAIMDDLYCFGYPETLMLLADRVLDLMDKKLGLRASIAKLEIFGLSLNENTITENGELVTSGRHKVKILKWAL